MPSPWLAVVCSAWLLGTASSDSPARVGDGLEPFARRHRRTQLTGMGLLTGWAVVNIGGGVAGAVLVDGDGRFFHQMNAMWNSVNLTLGIIGLVNNGRRMPAAGTRRIAEATHRKTQVVYLINGALDLVYIGGGVLTAELGRRYGQARVEGYGKSVVLQGAFLFAFDLGMLIAHDRVAAHTLRVRWVPTVRRGNVGFALAGEF